MAGYSQPLVGVKNGIIIVLLSSNAFDKHGNYMSEAGSFIRWGIKRERAYSRPTRQFSQGVNC